MERSRSLGKVSKRLYDVSMKLGWTISRKNLLNLCQLVAVYGVSVLEIDGITPNTHPQNCIEHANDFAVALIKSSAVSSTNGIQVLTLLNYPRPKEQYSYFAYTHYFIYGLRHIQPFSSLSTGWHTFRQSLFTFENAVRRGVFMTSEGSLRIARELQALLAENGLKQITTIDFYNRKLC
ncbi:hypothetical protein BGZ74_007871 [Mortierella antarctica]|nr:hypothetical protein BGZ74_007871 [Mortierella antarctica]